jgi:hypothetical protein
MHVDNNFFKVIDHCDYSHIIWTKIWELYEDIYFSTIPQ